MTSERERERQRERERERRERERWQAWGWGGAFSTREHNRSGFTRYLNSYGSFA